MKRKRAKQAVIISQSLNNFDLMPSIVITEGRQFSVLEWTNDWKLSFRTILTAPTELQDRALTPSLPCTQLQLHLHLPIF